MKISFFITRSIVLLSLILISCSDEVNELPLEETQNLRTLKSNFPDVYDQIDINTYQTHSVTVPDKGIVNVEVYEIQNNKVTPSYYLDMNGRKLITSITDYAIIQKDIETNQQFIIPRVYDTKTKRLIPDFEKAQAGFISKINSAETSEVDICETVCLAQYIGCMIGCGITGITIATQDTILPGIYDIIGVGVFTGCAINCTFTLDACLASCG